MEKIIIKSKKHGLLEVLVDLEDYEYLSKFKWYVWKGKSNNTLYVRRNKYEGNKQITILMHRLIMDVSDPKIVVDHVDRNALNNQRSNLRKCSNSQNVKNVKRKGSSIYAGVSYHKGCKKWVAGISKNGDGKRVHIGIFSSEIEAAKAYDREASIYFGEFANLNFK